MNPIITCKYCKKEFPMEEGLSLHLETIENQRREKADKEINDKLKKKLEKLELLENENKEKDKKIENINKQKETEIKNAVKTAVDTTKKDLDKENKEHYQSLYETKLKEEKGNLNEQNNEKQKLIGSPLRKGISSTAIKFGISFNKTELNQAGALVHVYTDGSIRLGHGGTEMGQGLFITGAQVVADVFSVPVGNIELASTTWF